MSSNDEPILGPEFDPGLGEREERPDIAENIRRLVMEQAFCVLCTQGQDQPYGSLIAYAPTEDVKTLFFSTPVATRKFKLLSECSRVAFLIDNRCQYPEDMTRIEAVTITGRASRIEAGPDLKRGIGLLRGRHPYLEHFLKSDSTALFRVDVIRCLHVTRFQEVSQWIP
jgi:uncharacterized protein YhbP (UPF0306 family)